MTELYHDTPEQATKVCSTCLKEKPLSNFYRESRRKDGHKSICKICCDAQTRGELAIGNLVQLPLSFETRACADCNIEKPLYEFGQKQRRCKDCQNARYRNSDKGQEIAVKRAPLKAKQKGNKVCRACLKEKPLSEFGYLTISKDRYDFRCKQCKHDEYMANQETAATQGHARYERDKEIINARNRERWAKNSERYNASHYEWTKQNRNKCNAIIRRYKARKRGATTDAVDYDCILERDGRWCHICEKPIEPHQKLHFDHVIPLARGGSHSEDNIKPSHAICNTRKKHKLLSELTPYQRRGII